MPTPSFGVRAGLIGVLSMLAIGPTAQAQTDYFWNAPNGGPGTWNITTQNWSDIATGPVDYTWQNNGNERANFGNTPGLVSFGAPMLTYGVNFLTTGYAIGNGGTAANTLTLTGASGIIDTGAGTDSIVAVIAGGVGLTKNSSGTLFLSGTNTFTGGTTVNAGVIAFNNATALGSATGGATVPGSGAALQILAGASVTYTTPLTLTGTGIGNTGALRNSLDATQGSTSTWSGPITIGSGGARINSDGAGTSLTMTGGINSGTAGTPLTIGGAGNTSVTTVAIGANIGQLTKDGTGTLTLGVANSYTGGTVINAGSVAVSNATGLGATTVGVTVNSGGALNIAAAITGQALTLNGGGSTTSATGPSTGGALRGTAASSWSGPITLNSSSRINDDSGAMTLSGGINSASSNLTLTFGGTAGAAFTISGPGIGSGIGAVVKDATSTLTLSTANAYTGGTTILGGAIVGTAQATGSPFGSTTGPVTLDTATLRLNSIAATTVTQVGTFIVNPLSANGSGAASLIVDNTAGSTGHTTTFAAGNLVRGGAGSVLVITPVTNNLGTGTGTGEVITFTGGTATTNGILPPWVVAGSSTTGADFATYGANGVQTATSANSFSPADLTTSTSSSVVNQSSPVTLAGPAAAFALKTNQVIGLNANTLTLGNGAGPTGLILNTGGSITGGTLTFGPTEGTVYVQGTTTLGAAGDTIRSNGLDVTVLAAGTLTLNGNITDATAPSRLVVTTAASGSTLTVGGNNTYTGGTTVEVTGTINLNSDTAFGASTGKVTIVLPAGSSSPTVQANAPRTIANPIDANIGLTFAGTNSMTFTGPINVIQSQAAGSRTFSNATAGLTVTFGSNGAPSTLTLGNPVTNGGDGVGKNLILSAGNATATFVVNDVIQDPAAGGGAAAGTLNIAGAGTVAMNALSTYSGGTLLNGAATIIPISVSSNALPGPSFTAGPFGTGPITVNNSSNQHLRPIGGNQTISNQIIMGTGFAMDNATGDTTSSLTFAGPILMQGTGRFLSNGFTTSGAGTPAGTMFLGSAAAPSTITLPYVPNTGTSLAALAGPIVVNDVIQQPTGIVGNISVNPNTGDINTITFNASSTYTGTTTIGAGVNVAGAGIIQIGVSSNALPGASFTSGPFGTGTVITNGGASFPPIFQPIGADRTVANAITMTSGFFVQTATAAQDPTGPHNLTLTGPISLGTVARVLTNNLAAGTTLTLGSAASPSTISLGSTAGTQLQFQSTSGTGTTVVNSLIQNASSGGAGTVLVTSGTVQLTNANTYSGATSITGGKLLVNNTTGSGTGTSSVTVTGSGTQGTGGTLGGSGTISGPISLSTPTQSSTSGGTLSPGNSPGTLTVAGAMTWNPIGTYQFDYDATATGTAPLGGLSDLVRGTSTATLNLANLTSSTPFTLNLNPVNFATSSSPVTYTIADFSAAPGTPITAPAGIIGTDLTPFFVVSGAFQPSPAPTVTLANGGNQITVTFTPVPEPAFVMAACGGLAAIGAWRRRRVST